VKPGGAKPLNPPITASAVKANGIHAIKPIRSMSPPALELRQNRMNGSPPGDTQNIGAITDRR
jgi:hypothetical protein